MKKNARRGFTLPEILVTVTVVAVLAAVVVPAVTQYVNKGDAPSTVQDLNQLRNAITAYVADTRQYPTYLSDLTAQSGVTGYKGPYFAGQVAGATSTSTFTSSGLNVRLTGAFADSAGYLQLHVVPLNGTGSCQDLYNLDKYVDQGTGATATASAGSSATSGSLLWDNSLCGTTATTAPQATLRLIAKGA